MKNLTLRAVRVAYIGLCLAVNSCGSANEPRLSAPDAIRIAEDKASRDLAGGPSYHRTSASYIREDRKWIVAYQRSDNSRFTVEVDDRTGESQIWMP